MADATFKHGSPRMVEYTPVADIAAGDVVVTDNTPRVAHLPIATGVQGSLAAAGGVYEMAGDAAIDADVVVYWDVSASKVSESADTGTNVMFGFTVTECSGDAALCLVRHEPQAVPAA